MASVRRFTMKTIKPLNFFKSEFADITVKTINMKEASGTTKLLKNNVTNRALEMVDWYIRTIDNCATGIIREFYAAMLYAERIEKILRNNNVDLKEVRSAKWDDIPSRAFIREDLRIEIAWIKDEAILADFIFDVTGYCFNEKTLYSIAAYQLSIQEHKRRAIDLFDTIDEYMNLIMKLQNDFNLFSDNENIFDRDKKIFLKKNFEICSLAPAQ